MTFDSNLSIGRNPYGGYLDLSDGELNTRFNMGLVSTNRKEFYANIYNNLDEKIIFIGQSRDGDGGGLIFYENGRNDEGNLCRAVSIGAIDGEGSIRVDGRKVHDYAEVFELATRDGVSPGSVVAWDPASGGVLPASTSNARLVVGVISGAGAFRPGMVIGSRADGTGDLPVSMSGMVYARVSGESGPVGPGDLLVPSSVAGVGMRAVDSEAAAGTIYGKALDPWSGPGEGLVRMLVMSR